ncbi:hypothetical protein LCGC14_0427840 [marine sediment metagenome]|uniref:Uncharacterized protein n=1 Tax=marine sediment metagenome TaxID=412755 RepID=A0A0F9SVF4_9ZZZZ
MSKSVYGKRVFWPFISGYFIIIMPCRNDELGIIEKWERWFKSRKIKTLRREMVGRTVLYREGYQLNFYGPQPEEGRNVRVGTTH